MRIARGVRWVALGVLCTLLLLALTAAVLALRFQGAARTYFITVLQNRYHSKVQLGDLQLSFYPRVRVVGKDLVMRFEDRAGTPPLVKAKQFSAEANFIGFFRYPRQIRRVRLEGLELQIPPKREKKSRGSSARGDLSKVPFVLQEIVADGTTLTILPKKAGKDPLVFELHQLTLHSVGAGRPLTFQTQMNNAKPPGLIHSRGEFGPWRGEQPGDTPVSGQYTFRQADLSVFKGISGMLASDGTYNGTLDTLEVKGWTDVPDFALSIADHPLHLRTEFEATVDGTDGDTILHPVRALLGESAFEVNGAISHGSAERRKTILLGARASNTHLEDFLRLSVKSAKPPMAGLISFETIVKIPPGEAEIPERLQLSGTFSLRNIRFTSPDVQGKIAGLSRRAQGNPKDKESPDVRAQFQGRFRMGDGILRLPVVTFNVPGASVRLAGNYALRSGQIDFRGAARTEARVSQMTTGFKSLLLKPLDPLFKRDGAGAVLPIRIRGTRGHPSFRLEIGRVLTRQ